MGLLLVRLPSGRWALLAVPCSQRVDGDRRDATGFRKDLVAAVLSAAALPSAVTEVR